MIVKEKTEPQNKGFFSSIASLGLPKLAFFIFTLTRLIPT
jgi:hypothetical protein